MVMTKELVTILAIFAFGLGACVASFLNVVIWRVPRGESLVSPPSHCPKCGARIAWYQNIPILAYLALRGKCASCRVAISPRYFFVELLGGCLFLASFYHLVGVGAPLYHIAVWWIWLSFMIAGSFIDFDHQLLPDFATIGGMILGVLFALSESFRVHAYAPVVASLIGLAFGFGLLALIRWAGSKVFHREAMGLGDVFLMGAVGALWGVPGVLVSLLLSSVFGSIVGLLLVLFAKTKVGKFMTIPYGPYICLGCLVHMFWGEQLITAYLRLLGVNV